MRRSSERHPQAVLRRIIKLNQSGFSKLVGLSESTVSKVESLRLPLSVPNALMISSQTGCSAAWLLEGDPKSPPRAAFPVPEKGDSVEPHDKSAFFPYTVETFQWVRAHRNAGKLIQEVEDPQFMVVADSLQLVLRALHRATKMGNVGYANVRLYDLANTLSKDLGITDPIDEDYEQYENSVWESVVQLTKIDMPGKA